MKKLYYMMDWIEFSLVVALIAGFMAALGFCLGYLT